MSQLYVGSICLSDIPEDKKQIGRNGKTYVSITLWVNDNVDQYGYIGSVHISQSQEQRLNGERRVYIGNFKTPVVITQPANSAPPKQDDDAAWNEFLSR